MPALAPDKNSHQNQHWDLHAALARYGLNWAALQTPSGVQALDAQFLDKLAEQHPELARQLLRYREEASAYDRLQTSALLIDVARYLEDFIAERFGITDALQQTAAQTLQFDDLYTFREKIIARKVRRYRRPIAEDFTTLHREIIAAAKQARRESGAPRMPVDPMDSPGNLDGNPDALTELNDPDELLIARYAVSLLADERANAEPLTRVVQWAKLGQTTEAGQAITRDWMSFSLPKLVEPTQLVPIERIHDDPYQRQQWHDDHAPGNPRFRQRQDFSLSDNRASIPEVQAEIDYCKYCHDHEGDFCARGFFDKKGQLDKGFREDAFGQALVGCPLEEKISEMQWLKREGRALAALAMAMADNPMIPATGHRICNDCMKACIYQKQDPVDVPQIETRILTDALDLPWGVELYDLLRRWNPLRETQFAPVLPTQKRVLIVGMGPAGFSLAHHLLMAGCTVVGVDGLKIEPINPALTSDPIRDWSAWLDNLDTRELTGFGGVAEYGITSRWDKNFLKLIYLSLSREANFAIHGGVRFGGTITIESAWQLGFDHIALATGAGHPKVLDVPNGLATGMRQANDFLMALQLTGAAKAESLAKLQVQLPALVIGGGLTAIDTATEIGVYYLRQIERTAARYQQVVAEVGEAPARAAYSDDELAKLDRFLAHAREYAQEQTRANSAGEAPNTVALIRRWGGVTVVYRKRLHDSPAYRRNHEEVEKALQEGIYFREQLMPLAANVDDAGNICAMQFADTAIDEAGNWQHADTVSLTLPARSIMVATGTVPNTVYAKEFPGALATTGNHYLPHALTQGELVAVPEVATAHVKSEFPAAFLTNYRSQDRFVSFVGDAHPQYQGTVVKAIASAQHAYPSVLSALALRESVSGKPQRSPDFLSDIREQFSARLVDRQSLSNGLIELQVKAPAAAQAHQPGQIYRLQSFEQAAPRQGNTPLQLSPMALSVAGVLGEPCDTLRLMIAPSASQRLVIESLPINQPVVLLGPSGAAVDLPRASNVLLMSARWGLPMLLELAQSLKQRGNVVRMLLVLADAQQNQHQAELEALADQISWLTESGNPVPVPVHRPQDQSWSGLSLSEALSASQSHDPAFWAELAWWQVVAEPQQLQHIREWQAARREQGQLSPTLRLDARIASPMQCMLKGVCGQCLQWLVDPETGERTQAIFTCAAQDQPLATIDLPGLQARQRQDSVMATLNRQWLAGMTNQEEAIIDA